MAITVATPDGGIVLAGNSFGDWNGTNAGEEDFIAVKIDTDGKELWRWQVCGRTEENSQQLSSLVAGNGAACISCACVFIVQRS